MLLPEKDSGFCKKGPIHLWLSNAIARTECSLLSQLLWFTQFHSTFADHVYACAVLGKEGQLKSFGLSMVLPEQNAVSCSCSALGKKLFSEAAHCD
jgi:hypothetical protein